MAWVSSARLWPSSVDEVTRRYKRFDWRKVAVAVTGLQVDWLASLGFATVDEGCSGARCCQFGEPVVEHVNF